MSYSSAPRKYDAAPARAIGLELPVAVQHALIERDEARRVLKATEERLQKALMPHAGDPFELDGVRLKVCGKIGELYVRRMGRTKAENAGRG